MKYLLIILLITASTNLFAQSVAINTDGSAASVTSILDVKSTAKGILIPRMSKAEKNAIAAPASGLLIYQNAPDSIGFYFYSGSSWLWLQNSSEGWSVNGNNSITTSNFLGSINNAALRFKVNNQPSGIIDSTNQNTSFGYQSLYAITSGNNNTAIGFDAAKKLNATHGNTAVGNKALAADTTGWENVAIGDSAMGSAEGYNNTAVGFYALKNVSGGGLIIGNTAIGYASQIARTGAPGYLSSGNTSVGALSLQNNVSGTNNVAIGLNSMQNVDSSSGNVAIGLLALRDNNRTDFSQNVAIGAYALLDDKNGLWNTAIGGDAMRNTIRSTLNSAVGFRTLKSMMDGGENSTLGVGTMEYKDTALSCIAIGRFALSGNDYAGYLNNNPDTGSIAIGTRAGRYNNTNYNTFIGYESGIGDYYNPQGITGGQTVSIGAFSLNKLQSGVANSTFGYAALFNNISGSKNIAVGSKSLYGNQTGNYNIGIGDSALYNLGSLLVGPTQATGNIAIGSRNMYNNIYGINNISIGREAFRATYDASNNIGIGYRVGDGITFGNSNIFIGNNAGGILDVSNRLFIENSNADKDNALIYGDFAADSLTLNAKTVIRDNAIVKGFTKLGGYGTEVPNIKMKTITGTTPTVDNFLSYPTGIADNKVLSFDVLVEYSSGWKMPPSYRDAAGYEYNVQFQGGNVVIINKAGNSANIGTKPFRVLITYEQ